MPMFLTIGYGDEDGYNRTPGPIRNAAHAHDAKLREAGVLMGIAGRPVQVRNPEGTNFQTVNGAYMTAALPVAGFALIEADSLAQAADIISRSPCAVAHGVVEVWPIEEAR